MVKKAKGLFDLKKLTAAPWGCIQACVTADKSPRLMIGRGDSDATKEVTISDIRFIIHARVAFEIQMKRKWTASRDFDGWCVIDDACMIVTTAECPTFYPDPISALIAAEEWQSAKESK